MARAVGRSVDRGAVRGPREQRGTTVPRAAGAERRRRSDRGLGRRALRDVTEGSVSGRRAATTGAASQATRPGRLVAVGLWNSLGEHPCAAGARFTVRASSDEPSFAVLTRTPEPSTARLRLFSLCFLRREVTSEASHPRRKKSTTGREGFELRERLAVARRSLVQTQLLLRSSRPFLAEAGREGFEPSTDGLRGRRSP